ncbi:MAG: AMP-binding protein, partial [Chloroflexota bacterium]
KKTDSNLTVVSRFKEVVSTYSDLVAVSDGKTALDYSALNNFANKIAWEILGLRTLQTPSLIKPPIPLLFDQNVSVVASILGVLKAGHAYTLLPSIEDEQKLISLLEALQTNILITDKELEDKGLCLAKAIPGRSQPLTVIAIDPHESIAQFSNPQVETGVDDLASIVYELDSNGRWRGAMHAHRTILHSVAISQKILNIQPQDRLAVIHDSQFGPTLTGFHESLLAGASTYLVPSEITDQNEFVDWIRQHQINHLDISTGLFAGEFDTLGLSDDLDTLKSIVANQALRQNFQLNWSKFSNQAIYIRCASTPETALIAHVTSESDDFLEDKNTFPVGLAADDKNVFLLDENQAPVAVGEEGTIHVGSRYLSLGYWNNPNLTAEFFKKDPSNPEYKIFDTGMLGRFESNGQLSLLNEPSWIGEEKVSLEELEKNEPSSTVDHAVIPAESELIEKESSEPDEQLNLEDEPSLVTKENASFKAFEEKEESDPVLDGNNVDHTAKSDLLDMSFFEFEEPLNLEDELSS